MSVQKPTVAQALLQVQAASFQCCLSCGCLVVILVVLAIAAGWALSAYFVAA